MQRDRFIAERRPQWERLDGLAARAAHGKLGRFTADELLELGSLYRAATSDLAIARRDLPGDRVTLYLNGLVARAHPAVYQERAMDVGRIGEFIRFTFPQAFRDAWRHIALAMLLLFGSAVIAALLVDLRPTLADVLLGDTAAQLRGVMEHHHLWVKSATENHSVAESEITTNNIRVAFFAFAGGVLVGLPCFYVLVQNGIMLGAIAAMVQQYNLSQDLWSFIAPHGVVELSVICISAGAGLMIGDAILRPGLQPRSLALTRAARPAAYLLIGCVPLLIFAGATESFYSPSDLPFALKVAWGIGSGIALYSYVWLSRPRQKIVRYRFDELRLPSASQSRISVAAHDSG